jgi:NAD(P)-dependent dehydrogenase (short-subunit alcohol dehydrogenase family)
MNNIKTVLITGANKGIGFEAARQLGALGFVVLLGARSEERGLAATATLKSEGIKAHFILLDVTRQDTINDAFEKIERELAHSMRSSTMWESRSIKGLLRASWSCPF